MNVVLFLVLLVLVGGAYYENNLQLDETDRRTRHITELSATVEELKGNVADLTAGNAALDKTLTSTQAPIGDLSSQIDASKEAAEQAKAQQDQSVKAAQASNDATAKIKQRIDTILHPVAPTNNLGTMVILDGKSYEDCRLLGVETHDIIVGTSSGVFSLYYPMLPVEVQKKLGYDRYHPGDLSKSQARFQERIRAEAGD